MDGSAQALPYRLRKTIQSIKEVVGNHSDSDIYAALEEANMDPNETTQKLLNQGGARCFWLIFQVVCLSLIFLRSMSVFGFP